jgi:hypothetical protein
VSGVVAGLIGSVKSGAASPTNLITNPSFTTDLSDWGTNPETSRVTDVFKSAPASLYQTYSDFYTATTGFVKYDYLTVGQVYSLSIWIKGAPLRVALRCGVNEVEISPPTTAVFTNYKIENVLCTANGLLLVDVGSGADTSFWIDDVSVVLGATALVL